MLLSAVFDAVLAIFDQLPEVAAACTELYLRSIESHDFLSLIVVI